MLSGLRPLVSATWLQPSASNRRCLAPEHHPPPEVLCAQVRGKGQGGGHHQLDPQDQASSLVSAGLGRELSLHYAPCMGSHLPVLLLVHVESGSSLVPQTVSLCKAVPRSGQCGPASQMSVTSQDLGPRLHSFGLHHRQACPGGWRAACGCVCDQDLGPEKGGELPGPPRCGSEAMAAPGRLGSHQVPPSNLWGPAGTAAPSPVTVKRSVHWRHHNPSHSRWVP